METLMVVHFTYIVQPSSFHVSLDRIAQLGMRSMEVMVLAFGWVLRMDMMLFPNAHSAIVDVCTDMVLLDMRERAK
jgi:hypothetical protein